MKWIALLALILGFACIWKAPCSKAGYDSGGFLLADPGRGARGRERRLVACARVRGAAMSDADTTPTGHSRARLASQVRKVNPRRLAEWDGWNVKGRQVNPYRDYVIALLNRDPREKQIAELLVGDTFVDALLHPSMTAAEWCVRPDGSEGFDAL